MVQSDTDTVEQELTAAMDWAKSPRLVRPGEYVVLVRGQVPGEDPRPGGPDARQVRKFIKRFHHVRRRIMATLSALISAVSPPSA